uniref:Uncharacterized protein n=1 Tax=Rhizophora mucronata TaxID=61149 RepID=A0A2P2PFD5_RHIMU
MEERKSSIFSVHLREKEMYWLSAFVSWSWMVYLLFLYFVSCY